MSGAASAVPARATVLRGAAVGDASTPADVDARHRHLLFDEDGS